MSDKLKESVSALVDDETDELELRRILAQSHDNRVMEPWQRYHHLRAALNHEEARWVGIDLRQGINAALDESVANSQAGSGFEIESKPSQSESATNIQSGGIQKSDRQSKRWWNGLAIAASVAFAMVIAVQFGDPVRQNNPVVAGNNSVSLPAATATDKINPQQFSEEHEARLNEYIMRHTGHAALNTGKSILPFARLTSFEPEQD